MPASRAFYYLNIETSNLQFMMRCFIALLLLIGLHTSCLAQIDVGAGLGIVSPFLYNKYVGSYNHSQVSYAANIRISYLPENATFLPSLNVTLSPYILPVTRLGSTFRVLNMDFTAVNAMLQGRVRKQIGTKELYYGIGVGATYLSGNSVDISGDHNLLKEVIIDSSEYIKRIIPQACLNAEFVLPISREKPVYAGIGVQILYTYLFDQQTAYRVDVVDVNGDYYKLAPKLGGHMVTPCAYVAVYYRFGRRQ